MSYILQWWFHFKPLSVVVTRYLYSSITSTLLSWTTETVWDGEYFLTSMHLSLGFVVLRHKYDLSRRYLELYYDTGLTYSHMHAMSNDIPC